MTHRKRNMRLAGVILGLLLVPMANIAMAATPLTCKDLSPGKKNGIDLLVDERGERLIASELKAVKMLFKRMSGHWRGVYKRRECLEGANGTAPKSVEMQVFVEALWTTNRVLDLETSVIKRGREDTDVSRLFFKLHDGFIREALDDERQTVLVLEAGATRLSTYRRQSQWVRNRYSPVEIGSSLSLNGKRLTIRKVVFKDGSFALEETWRLRR